MIDRDSCFHGSSPNNGASLIGNNALFMAWIFSHQMRLLIGAAPVASALLSVFEATLRDLPADSSSLTRPVHRTGSGEQP